MKNVEKKIDFKIYLQRIKFVGEVLTSFTANIENDDYRLNSFAYMTLANDFTIEMN